MESCWHNFMKFSSLLVQNLTSCQLWNKGESVLFRHCLPDNNLTDDCWVFSCVLACCSFCAQQPFWRAWRCTLPCTSGHSLKCECGWLLILSEMVLTHLMLDTRENLTLPKRAGSSSPYNCRGRSPISDPIGGNTFVTYLPEKGASLIRRWVKVPSRGSREGKWASLTHKLVTVTAVCARLRLLLILGIQSMLL